MQPYFAVDTALVDRVTIDECVLIRFTHSTNLIGETDRHGRFDYTHWNWSLHAQGTTVVHEWLVRAHKRSLSA